MTTLTRLAVGLMCALGIVCPGVSAQTSAKPGSAPTMPPDLAAFLAAQPKWNTSAALSAGYGLNDNVLLSSSGENRSAFARGGAEFLIFRVPPNRVDFSFFVQGERTQLFSPVKMKKDGIDRAETFDHEAKVWVRTEPAYRISDTLKIGLPLTGYYYDQVFDVSDTEVDRTVAEFRVKGAIVAPVIRWDFHPSGWVEAQALGQRKRYDDGANDGQVGEGALRVGWTFGSRLEIQVAGARRWRDFDHRLQYSAAGREGSEPLKIAEREGEAAFEVTWDEAAHWQTTTRFNLLHYQDNGSGFFNYREQKVTHQLKWHDDLWLARIGGSAGRLDFSVQKGELGFDAPLRIKDEFTGELHLERKLGSRWTIFGDYIWERSRSNDMLASYTVNEGLLGVRWSWDK